MLKCGPFLTKPAILGAVIAFLSGVTAILSQGHGIDLNGWLTAALAGFIALNGVWLVPNAPPKGTP